MTQALQPNAFCAGLRRALDIVRDQDELRARVFDGIADPLRVRESQCAAHYMANILDALADQLLDAGGFLGDAPEPEEMRATVRGWTVCYTEADSYAWFERDSDGTGGGLWFDNGALVDYDGVACLPAAVADAVRQLGLTVPADME